MARFTVLGSSGFIGSHLLTHLQAEGHDCDAPAREETLNGDLGHVVYCIGLTADFRRHPWDTLEAHVGKLVDLLRNNRFDSLLYLSSTRVYQRLPTEHIADEDAVLPVNPADPSDLYNLSKLAGEAACLAHPSPAVRIARLANVYGPDPNSDNFLSAVLREALVSNRVELQSALSSVKDYVSIQDVVHALRSIALEGRQRLYNVASGHNVSNREIAGWLRQFTGCEVKVNTGAPVVKFPLISIARLQGEFDLQPVSLEGKMTTLIQQFRNVMGQP